MRRHVQRREAYAYVVTEGTLPACQAATTFLLVGDQLYAGGDLVTADPAGHPYQVFPRGAGPNGTVAGGFSVDIADGAVLRWTSASFGAGNKDCSASFCVSSTNEILAVYVPGSAPSVCSPVTLSYVSSACSFCI